MHAVAVTRARGLHAPEGGYREPPRTLEDPTREEIVRVLAPLTGMDEADWRMRVGGPLPWVLALEPDGARAVELTIALRRSGFGAVSCATDDAKCWSPRSPGALVLDETELGFLEHPRRIAYGAIRATVLATLATETTTEEIERVAAGRGQGQPVVHVSHYRSEGARSRALYLVLGPGETTVRLEQGAARLAVPGGKIPLGSSARSRFDECAAAILERTPSAIRDTRLLTARRGRRGFSTGSDGVTHTTSNVRETDLVAHLIAVAWIERQIDASP